MNWPSLHLSPTPLALGCSFNDTRQVQQLYLGVIVVNHARYTGEGGELVRGCF
jgi:hypothetical protein